MLNKMLLAAAIFVMSPAVFSAPSWTGGNILNLTSTSAGVMIIMDSGAPDNCAGTPHGWLLVRNQDKVMAAMVMAMWASERKAATVYTSGIDRGTGFCVVTQVDPAE